MAQISILPALDAAGAHPGSGRPQIRHNDWMELWRPGAPIPPGMAPPVPGVDELPWWYFEHEGEADREIAEAIWSAVHAAVPAGIPWPWADIYETHRLPDGALWACMVSATDGGLSHVVLRDGVLEWTDAPGAGAIIWREATHTWARLPAKEFWDVEAQAWVPNALALHVTSAPPDVEPPAPEPVPAEAAPVSADAAAFLHAINMATDAGWRALADSMDRTTPEAVRQAVARRVLAGDLSVANGEALLERAGVAVTPPPEEPAPVAEPAQEPEPTEDDIGPVAEHEPVLPPPDFMKKLLSLKAATFADRQARWDPLDRLVEAGLATRRTKGDRWSKKGRCDIELAPPASDLMTLSYNQALGFPSNVTLRLREGADPDDEIVWRVAQILDVAGLERAVTPPSGEPEEGT